LDVTPQVKWYLCLLKNGIKVSLRGKKNEEIIEKVQVIDWNEPSNNDFFLASQMRRTEASTMSLP